MAVLGKSLNSEHSPALENLLPLPGGEGWGEGEREFQLNSYGFRLQNCVNRPVRQRKRCIPLRGSSLFGHSNAPGSEARDKRRRINDNFDLCTLKLEFNLSP